MALSLTVLIFACVAPLIVRAAVLSTDPKFGNWLKLSPNDQEVKIPVFIDTEQYANDTECLANIRAAIVAINSDLAGCVGYTEVDNTMIGADFLFISQTFDNNVSSPVCQALPGHVTGQNQTGQQMIIAGKMLGGANCCGSVRDVMRYLMHNLGLRNEFQRPDRPFSPNNSLIVPELQPFTPYKSYVASNNVRIFNPRSEDPFSPVPAPGFDFQSITMLSPDKFSATGEKVWQLPEGAAAVGSLPRISLTDCQAITFKYGCMGSCGDPYAVYV